MNDKAAMDYNIDEKSSKANIDYRMVTFTLAGRDYAIDIMKVREISKDNKFTYVPNSAPFVVGVYNLRGDIISVIDLRIFFNQMDNNNPAASDKLENMIILRLEDHTIAVIVDTIDKVVGIPSESIQPPHPLFGDINVKYISGVVESDNKLYIILDVESIFNSEEPEVLDKAPLPVPDTSVKQILSEADNSEDDLNLKFISESLLTFKKMYLSSINKEWILKRYKDWSQSRKASGQSVQFVDENDADKFMETFYSPYTGNLWGPDYIDSLKKILPQKMGAHYYVLNGGCGIGAEAYSLASVIKKNNPQVQLKILAYDNDLMNISSAPALNIEKELVPDYYWNLLTQTLSGGWQFNETIKESIIFEYHDISHNVNLPALDMVVIRDLLSLLTPEVQRHVLTMIMDNLKPNGILIVGKNEKIDENSGFSRQVIDGLSVYIKK